MIGPKYEQGIDALINSDENPELGDVLDSPFDRGPHRVTFANQVPGIRLRLFEAEDMRFSWD